MNKVLVAGVNGFVGKHLARTLVEQGCSVIGTGLSTSVDEEIQDYVSNYTQCDLNNANDLPRIDLEGVESIINLAGLADVGRSFQEAERYIETNSSVQVNLLREVINRGIPARVIAISTGGVYDPEQKMPLDESSSLISDERTNPYIISKKRMENALLDVAHDSSVDLIIARPFNHTGPGQTSNFLIPRLIEEITRSSTSGAPVSMGNMHTKRDFTDVRDIVDAYVGLALADSNQLNNRIYNVCSARSYSGDSIFKMLVRIMQLPDVQYVVDPEKIRKNDVLDIVGSHDKISRDIGWKPRISIEETLHAMVDIAHITV